MIIYYCKIWIWDCTKLYLWVYCRFKCPSRRCFFTLVTPFTVVRCFEYTCLLSAIGCKNSLLSARLAFPSRNFKKSKFRLRQKWICVAVLVYLYSIYMEACKGVNVSRILPFPGQLSSPSGGRFPSHGQFSSPIMQEGSPPLVNSHLMQEGFPPLANSAHLMQDGLKNAYTVASLN